MSTIGIPYAYACEQCFRAVICPHCGMHIEEQEGDDSRLDKAGRTHHYADHYAAQHEGAPYPELTIRAAPDGCPLVSHEPQHDELDGECARCGELTSPPDRAEVAEGLVHAQCMHPGEEIA